MSHHNTALEGNTITLAETVSIILHQTYVNIEQNKNINLREIYEVVNSGEAFDFILNNKNELNISHIKEINKIVLDKLNINRGLFKEHQNYIVGASFNISTPQETPYLMQQLIDNTKYRLNHSKNNIEKIETILDMHIQFERIHPFADGNGRTGRLLINQMLYNENLPFLIIEKKDKAEYLHYLDTQDLKGFLKFALPKIKQEKERLISFNLTQNKRKKER